MHIGKLSKLKFIHRCGPTLRIVFDDTLEEICRFGISKIVLVGRYSFCYKSISNPTSERLFIWNPFRKGFEYASRAHCYMFIYHVSMNR